MKIRRQVIIALACVGIGLLCYLGICLKYNLKILESADMRLKMTYEARMANLMSVVFSTTCQLAVIDFLFCAEEKKYSKSMFAIAITLFVLYVAFVAVSVVLCTQIYFDAVNFLFWNFFVWIALASAPFVGLTVAYVIAKAKFTMSALERVKPTKQNED